MDLRNKGNWTLGKIRILGKMEIWKNSNMEICKLGKREIRENEYREKWKFEKK